MDGVRQFFQTGKGQVVAAALVAVAVVVAGYMLWHNVGQSPEIAAANTRWFIDPDGKSFTVDLSKASVPTLSPFTGKKTAYPAELCYWTKDGKTKSDPTKVFMNDYKGASGPTFCPDCGRLVVGMNPMAIPGMRPPPTEAEYNSSH